MSSMDPGVVKRFAIAAAALIVYGAGAAWLVSSEAIAHRAGLRGEKERRLAVAPAAEPPAKAGPTSRPEPEPPRPAVAAPPSIVKSAKPVTPDPLENAPAMPAANTAATAPAEATKVESESAERFWSQPVIKRVWDLEHMTPDEEVAYGRAIRDVILALNPESTKGASAERVHQAAKPLLDQHAKKVSVREGITYEFTVLDSPEINAFSTPGGFVYVTEGLLLSIPEDQVGALQFVLAHEMGHVEMGHALECLRNPSFKQFKNRGTIELHYNIVIPFAYFDDQDYKADRWALKALGKTGLGIEDREAIAFLKKYERIAKKNDFTRGRMKPDLTQDRTIVDNHFRAHVSITERLARAKSFQDGVTISDPPRASVPKR